jgi:hypothetical protein
MISHGLRWINGKGPVLHPPLAALEVGGGGDELAALLLLTIAFSNYFLPHKFH